MSLAILSLLAWIWLIVRRGDYWRAEPVLPACPPGDWPDVDVVVPARDEADVIAAAVGSLLTQDYRGHLRVILVDDGSTDGTAAIARAIRGRHPLRIVTGVPRPHGWVGKPWAMHQGAREATAPFVLFTDADIVHAPDHVASLVAQIAATGADLVSEMVALHRESFAERALIPAFVYFFALLYPFGWVNDGLRATAAAAGGTMMVRRGALARAGGIEAIAGALIDDIALARAIKRGGRIWLGHGTLARSIRPYPRVADIWAMIARSAYVQLRHSPLLLVATVLALGLVFFVPPLAVLLGGWWLVRLLGLAAWGLMAFSFVPILRRYGASLAWAPALPVIAGAYASATVASAVAHHRGQGVVWKQRAYTERQA